MHGQARLSLDLKTSMALPGNGALQFQALLRPLGKVLLEQTLRRYRPARRLSSSHDDFPPLNRPTLPSQPEQEILDVFGQLAINEQQDAPPAGGAGDVEEGAQQAEEDATKTNTLSLAALEKCFAVRAALGRSRHMGCWHKRLTARTNMGFGGGGRA